jgi:hypothetical protein
MGCFISFSRNAIPMVEAIQPRPKQYRKTSRLLSPVALARGCLLREWRVCSRKLGAARFRAGLPEPEGQSFSANSSRIRLFAAGRDIYFARYWNVICS